MKVQYANLEQPTPQAYGKPRWKPSQYLLWQTYRYVCTSTTSIESLECLSQSSMQLHINYKEARLIRCLNFCSIKTSTCLRPQLVVWLRLDRTATTSGQARFKGFVAYQGKRVFCGRLRDRPPAISCASLQRHSPTQNQCSLSLHHSPQSHTITHTRTS